jgi:hypothetical protein
MQLRRTIAIVAHLGSFAALACGGSTGPSRSTVSDAVSKPVTMDFDHPQPPGKPGDPLGQFGGIDFGSHWRWRGPVGSDSTNSIELASIGARSESFSFIYGPRFFESFRAFVVGGTGKLTATDDQGQIASAQIGTSLARIDTGWTKPSSQITVSFAPMQGANVSLGIDDLTWVVPLVIKTSSLSNGSVGVVYSARLIATGGITPYTWSIVSGMPPPGLVLDPQSGLISGTPLCAAGDYGFTVQVADSFQRTSAALAILVSPGAPTQLTFDGNPHTAALACSSSIAVQARDAAGNSSAVQSTLTATLTSSSSTGGFVDFYSDSACTRRISSLTIPQGGSTSGSIYFSRAVASVSPVQISAQSVGLAPALEDITLTRNATYSTVYDDLAWYGGRTSIPSPKTGVINVKAYGAYGDGVHDDTAAILVAMWSNVGAFGTRATNALDARDTILYFPSGTYLISRPLLWMDAGGSGYDVTNWTHYYADATGNASWVANLQLQGENRTDTVLRYVDAGQAPITTPCAQNGAVNSMVYTASNNSPFPLGGKKEGGESNEAFRNHLQNLTFDIGRNNPNMIAVDYAGSNDTRVDNVSIVSGDHQGCVGFNLWRFSGGPGLLSHVFIQGFDTGVLGSGELQNGLPGSPSNWTFEHFIVEDQNLAAFDFPGRVQASMRDAETRTFGAAPAFLVANGAGMTSNVVVLVDSSFVGSSTSAAIQLVRKSGAASFPYLFVRNTTETGYGSLVSENGSAVTNTGNEWSSRRALRAKDHSGGSSLDLPVRETPIFLDDTGNDHAAWTYPQTPIGCGGVNSAGTACDWTASLQAAIDSATSTLVIPWGWYGLSAPLQIGLAGHGMNLRRVLCLGCKLKAQRGVSGASALQIGDTSPAAGGTLWLDGLLTYYYPGAPHEDPFHFGSSEYPFPVEGMSHGSGSFVPVILSKAKQTTVVFRDMDNFTYMNVPGPTPTEVFMESVAFGPFIFDNQLAWTRNLDPEVAPASAAFLACSTGCDSGGKCMNQPPDFLQQGLSHAIVTGPSAQLWALGLKTENREWPTICCYSPDHQGCPNDGVGLPSNSLLEVDNGGIAEVLGLQAFDHRANSIDIDGNPIGAVRIYEATASIEGFMIGWGTEMDYPLSVQQFYPKNGQIVQSLIYEFAECSIEPSMCSYSNGDDMVDVPASSFPLYIGY